MGGEYWGTWGDVQGGYIISHNKNTWEEIEAFHRDGWNFRVKTVNGKQYLSARRGSDEKGLGPLTPELRDFLDTLNKSHVTANDTGYDKSQQQPSNYHVTLYPTLTYPTREMTLFSRAEVESALFDIRFERAKVKAIDCHYSWNGYCQYWKYTPNSDNFKKIYERFAAREYTLPAYSSLPVLKGQNREMLRVTELLCFDCDRYTPRIEKEKNS
jgi:hypothetical protein